jgi:predicted nucleic acid-binding protein
VILPDTCVWVHHFRFGGPALTDLLLAGQVCVHSLVIGELACGHLKPRAAILRMLAEQPQLPKAADEEVLVLIERHRLMGRGMGFIDAHLLASCLLAGRVPLWTLDRRLADMAAQLGLDPADRYRQRPDLN